MGYGRTNKFPEFKFCLLLKCRIFTKDYAIHGILFTVLISTTRIGAYSFVVFYTHFILARIILYPQSLLNV